jgi:geranylgeranyl reductase
MTAKKGLKTYDVAIIGAGPAGATCARLISRSCKTLLIEKRALLHPPKANTVGKCCGGLLAPDAQKMLGCLGLGLPPHVLVGPQLFVVRTIDLEAGHECYYQRHYINIDREKFDHWLVSLIPDTVDKRTGCTLRQYDRYGDGYVLTFTDRKKRVFSEKARVVVGADGAASLIRRLLRDSRRPKVYYAIQEWFYADNPHPYFSAIFDHEITDYYSWIIPKSGYLIVGSAIDVRHEVPEKFKLLKKKLVRYGFRFGETRTRKGALILRPVRLSQLYTGNKGVALIGESAGWISPSSAEGLSYAFKSAVLLAEALKKDVVTAPQRYHSSVQSLRRNIALKQLKSPFMYNSVLRRIVMKLGISSIKIV